MDDALALENRRRIYEHILEHPGSHPREMERELGLSTGVLTYHLEQLEKTGLIRSDGDGYLKGYFQAGRFSIKDRKDMAFLSSLRPKQIAILLAANSVMSFKAIQSELEISSSTLSHHLKRMASREVITSERREGEMFYRLKDPEWALAILSVIMSSKKDTVDRFSEIWSTLGRMK